MKQIKKKLALISIALAFASHVSLYITFLVAFFTDDKSIIIYINWFGEAITELVLLTITTLSIIYFTPYIFNKVYNEN